MQDFYYSFFVSFWTVACSIAFARLSYRIYMLVTSISSSKINDYIDNLLDTRGYKGYIKERYSNQLLYDYTFNKIDRPKRILKRIKDLEKIYDLEKMVILKENMYEMKNLLNNIDMDSIINKRGK